MEIATITIFCIAVMTTIAITFVPISHRVFAFETYFPPPLVPVPLIEDLNLQVDNLNFSFSLLQHNTPDSHRLSRHKVQFRTHGRECFQNRLT